MKILVKSPNERDWSTAELISYKDEVHMQEIIYNKLDVIPFEDIQPKSANLMKIPIKELGLPGSGSTDIVVVDQEGTIYIIETKLAKNPEAKRQVVGQILEYAAFLGEQDFNWLDSQVKSKQGKNFTEFFQDIQDWDKEIFEDNVANNLQQGRFKLIIVVDQLNRELQHTTQFMRDKLDIEIYPIELRYFKDKNETEILFPKVQASQKTKQSTKRPARPWDETSFFEDAKKKNGETLATIRKLYEIGKELEKEHGEVTWGRGDTYGTFQVRVPFKGKPVALFVIKSDGERNWFAFKNLTQLGADRALLTNYIGNLRRMGFPFNEAIDWNRYPEFKVSVLSKNDVLQSFKEQTLKFLRSLSQS